MPVDISRPLMSAVKNTWKSVQRANKALMDHVMASFLFVGLLNGSIKP